MFLLSWLKVNIYRERGRPARIKRRFRTRQSAIGVPENAAFGTHLLVPPLPLPRRFSAPLPEPQPSQPASKYLGEVVDVVPSLEFGDDRERVVGRKGGQGVHL